LSNPTANIKERSRVLAKYPGLYYAALDSVKEISFLAIVLRIVVANIPINAKMSANDMRPPVTVLYSAPSLYRKVGA
jgi:hypothetical protein